MEDYFNSSYEEAKDLAHKCYRRIYKVSCPYFEDEDVLFTSDGFNHLIRKGRAPRPKSEQRKRFYLLRFVVDIIKNPNAEVVYKQLENKHTINHHGEKISVTTKADFWTFIHKIDNDTIKVVIRRLKKDSPKHFFSVMVNRRFFRKIKGNKKSP